MGQQTMPAAVEDTWTKVTRKDRDFSLCIDQTLTSPIQRGAFGAGHDIEVWFIHCLSQLGQRASNPFIFA